jgi:hypothetical protein
LLELDSGRTYRSSVLDTSRVMECNANGEIKMAKSRVRVSRCVLIEGFGVGALFSLISARSRVGVKVKMWNRRRDATKEATGSPGDRECIILIIR